MSKPYRDTITDQSSDSLLARGVGRGGADGVPRRTAQTTDLMVPAASLAAAFLPTEHAAALALAGREARRYQYGNDWVRPVYDNDGTVTEIHEGAADGAPGSCEGLAEHIASWHPAVALAVADLLDACAENLLPGWVVEDDLVLGPALAVARAYLGEQP